MGVNTINLCYNSGTIEGFYALGGIVGHFGYSKGGNIKNCYNVGNIKRTNTNDKRIGGILGNIFSGTVENCYNIGNVCYSDNTKASGILGTNGSDSDTVCTITNCYYLTDTASGGIDGADVTGQAEVIAEEEMKKSTFVNKLNSGESNWKIVTGRNNGFPILSWQ